MSLKFIRFFKRAILQFTFSRSKKIHSISRTRVSSIFISEYKTRKKSEFDGIEKKKKDRKKSAMDSRALLPPSIVELARIVQALICGQSHWRISFAQSQASGLLRSRVSFALEIFFLSRLSFPSLSFGKRKEYFFKFIKIDQASERKK